MVFSAVFIGNQSLLIECARAWLAQGNRITAVISRSSDVVAWAQSQGLLTIAQNGDQGAALAGQSYDYIFSVANLSLVPEALLQGAKLGAINFHDGPLPKHAGLNAPVWAILEGENQHGITWHMIEGGIDEGDILVQRRFPILPDDTALTLNTRCFEAAIDSFSELIAGLQAGRNLRQPQDLALRSYHARDKRPEAGGLIDLTGSAEAAARLIRALDHGTYHNPLALPKLKTAQGILVVGRAEPSFGQGAAGQILAVDEAGVTLAFGQGALILRGLRRLDGTKVCPKTLGVIGDILPEVSPSERARIEASLARVTPFEGALRQALRRLEPAELPGLRQGGQPHWDSLPLEGLPLAALAVWACRLQGREAVDLAFSEASELGGLVSSWVPLRLVADPALTPQAAEHQAQEALHKASLAGGFAADLPLRDPLIGTARLPQIAYSSAGPVAGTVITLTAQAFHYDAARLSPDMAGVLHRRLLDIALALPQAAELGAIPLMPAQEYAQTVMQWNATDLPYDRTPIHRAFEAQVARSPDAVALVHEAREITFAALNEAANRLAHALRARGIGPGDLVGLATFRTPLLIIGALGILKAGAAYVPMDPNYPADRIALYIEDSAAPLVVSESAVAARLPAGADVLPLDTADLSAFATSNPEGGAGPDDLAYMIYTSGSTGRPKGVMIEHGNAANFFLGMDGPIGTDPGVWLSITSLSFDISVLEFFWTLTRGYKLVLMGEEDRKLVSSGGAPVSAQGIEFSLYYWGNDDGAAGQKYRLLLEGARFADENGFVAVWTPERHFHAFGGPYPNPSVTGAAVAGMTRNIGVRAGSCVAPLHHPARIAEEWAVIDNLTNGRAGLAMASGWQPEDFVLRPENTPPANRDALFQSIEQVRKLWRGEAVDFAMADGTPLPVITQPRPVSKELPVWVTTAGNPETWREAGRIGAHVLTHLLGQSLQEVAEKIALYHAALREGGHDPAQFKVTLMLHTFLAATREEARQIAREPMKDYLRSAAGLIKQYAWAFPAFKKPQGVSNPMQMDLRDLSGEEMEAILDFAFDRYFEESGLFGTIEDALARVEQLKGIGVSEVACLIDYGIDPDRVLAGLRPLAQVLARSNAGTGPAADDFSIAAQIRRHGVTHLQCTPSMARMLVMDEGSRAALSHLKTFLIGGEALPGVLVEDIRAASPTRILNMYGPTETTIWSMVEEVGSSEGVVNLGHPIANTRLYVLDEAMQPQPIGTAGELWIGGEGVARGYWQRTDLTEERFKPDPFYKGRMYRTGDLVRWRADGKMDFLGRADFQVKIRGHRIELGEIEVEAEKIAGLRQAVVLAREDTPGDLRLVLYVTGDTWLLPEVVRQELSRHLPEHMVPAHVVKLADFPLTPNRKVDRKALPAPSPSAEQSATFEAPTEGAQEVIAAVWQKVLNLPKVGAKDNFFALGGHSLLAVQAHRDIKAALPGAALSITDIFRFPTLQALADHLDKGVKSGAKSGAKPATPQPAPKTADFVPSAPVVQHPAVTHNPEAQQRLDAMAARRALRARREGEG